MTPTGPPGAAAPRRPHGIVAVVWVMLAVAYGLFFSFTVFFVALIEEFRWSRALTAGALSLSTIVQGVLGPLVGGALDRVGPRPVLAAGAVLLGGASLLTATVTAPWQLYLYTGVVGATGLAALGWVPMGVLLSRRVAERRGRITGIAFSGMGVGVFVLGPLAQWLIDGFGWRAATATLGLGVLVILVPLAWLGTREARGGTHRGERGSEPSGGTRPVPLRRHPTLADALRTRTFWALFAAFFLTPLAVFPVFTHQVAFAVDLGFARLFVAWIFGLMGLMSSVGRALFGWLTDRIGGALAATLSFGCTAGGALALVGLEWWPATGWLVAYALLFGLGFGARGPIITAMATDRFGGARFGVIYGALNMANGLGAALGPWFGGAVHDAFGSYRIAFLSSVVFSAAGSACFWVARRPPP